MVNELSAISLQADQISKVSDILAGYGIAPHFFQNLEAWIEVSGDRLELDAAGDSAKRAKHESPIREQCLLLVGPCAEIADRKLPERVNQIHPGLPIIAIGKSPSKQDIVRVVRQGAIDVIDLDCEPDSFCKTIQTAIEKGRATEQDRQRVVDLRRRLNTLTPAERQVLDAMMDGLANKETAKTLGIGLRTVELRRSKIMAKMGANTVAELVKLFCQARCPGLNTKASV